MNKQKNVKKLQLKVTACQMTEKDTNEKIDFLKYQLVIDDAVIGIGANDKFKELLKYLVGANNLEIGQTIVVEVK